jgi:AcrR family transcriptional regulator
MYIRYTGGMSTSLRERKKEQTRRQIAETARRLFGERGFEQVTVAEIARAAEVSTQTVFNYFPTKEDLVYWRLGAFEAELLAAVRERGEHEPALAAFKRFLLAQRGLLGEADPGAYEQLAALTRTIVESPALRAREQQILEGYTATLAAELGGDTQARVAAAAMLGVHRALITLTRTHVLNGTPQAKLAKLVRKEAEAAFALLENGLANYAA